MTQTRYSTGRLPALTVADLYTSMSTETLQQLRWAFTIDRASALDDPDALAFLDGRLRLLAQELGSRGVVAHELLERTP